ncbi:MFS transporter [Tabrizicola sp.]|uniref:MFS transporter n=1 Tax=Tabrizicola sp. TaxID=2005166 RepID=UPI00286C6118|nr:MFS transporter [Tabrizicola sp.]
MRRNIILYPWFKFVQQLLFWQATWFLYFESQLSAAEAILLYVVADLSTTVLEVPSGYMSDRLGRRKTLLVAAISFVAATVLLVVGEGLAQFALASILLGAASAFASGTDSSLLFESLKADGRASDIEAMELRAWRFSFSGLALSALTGGVLALYGAILPYVATTISALGLLAVTALFREPPQAPQAGHRDNLRVIGSSLAQPTLLWLLCLWLATYVFSHIPFVFGQPFIREAMTAAGHGDQTPLISGAVTFLMMAISLAFSLVALPLRKALGLPGVLLLAFGMQVALTAALAASNSLFVIALLLLRMVPDSLSTAFMTARVQTLLPSTIRATYLSLQSLAGRIVFSAVLSLAALYTPADQTLAYSDMQVILTCFAVFGVLVLAGLVVTTRKAQV